MSRLTYSSTASYRGNSGILKIENGSLVFVRKSGIVNPKEFVVQTVPLSSIRSLDVQGGKIPLPGIRGSVLVVFVDASKLPGIPRHEFHVASPREWISAIQSEMKTDAAQQARPPQPTYVKEIVREVVKYPCPFCSSLIEVTSARCQFCGAPQRK